MCGFLFVLSMRKLSFFSPFVLVIHSVIFKPKPIIVRGKFCISCMINVGKSYNFLVSESKYFQGIMRIFLFRFSRGNAPCPQSFWLNDWIAPPPPDATRSSPDVNSPFFHPLIFFHHLLLSFLAQTLSPCSSYLSSSLLNKNPRTITFWKVLS